MSTEPHLLLAALVCVRHWGRTEDDEEDVHERKEAADDKKKKEGKRETPATPRLPRRPAKARPRPRSGKHFR
eukprot:9490851-Pyramimonas_sp.AAC.1